MYFKYLTPVVASSLLLESFVRAGEDPQAGSTAEAFTLYPIPDYQSSIGTRATLTGDWGGARTRLAEEAGLQVSVDVNNYYQSVMSGGIDTRSEYSGTSDYRIKLDSSKAGLWQGGFIEVHGESYWGRSVNELTGAMMPVNTDTVMSLPDGNGTYLSHVVYTQFLSESFAVFLGKLDTSVGDANRFAHGVGDRKFMNMAFAFNPVLAKTAPYSTLGAGFLLYPAEGVAVSFTALDADGSINDSGFDTVFNGNTTLSTELILDSHFFAKPGRHTFGFSGSSKEYTSTDQDPRIFIPSLDVEPFTEDGSWAASYNFDQYIAYDPEDPSQGWGVFGRFGISDGKVNPIHRFYSLGLGGSGGGFGREHDRFGIGYYYLELTNKRLGLLTDDDEHGFEAFYNMSITPWFEMSADLQVIQGAGRFSDSAVVGALRGRISL